MGCDQTRDGYTYRRELLLVPVHPSRDVDEGFRDVAHPVPRQDPYPATMAFLLSSRGLPQSRGGADASVA